MPTPQVLVGEPPDSDPMPDGCGPERVVGIVLEFMDAFNRGDSDRLAALFRPDVLDADGTPDPGDQWRNPGWFAVRAISAEPNVVARNGPEMLAWTEARHAHGERWTLLQLSMAGYWWKGGVSIGFDLRREADDLPTRAVGGKGAIDCNHGTVFLWNIGPGEVLPDYLFEPGATPWAEG